MIFRRFFRHSIKRNIEKWIFFGLFLITCILIIFLILNLPNFKMSVYEKKINRKKDGAQIKKIELSVFEELKERIKNPVNYVQSYSRDPFSPHIERVTCPKCSELVAKHLDVCPFCSFEFDDDEDGIPNQWEKRYGLNPYDAQDAYLDKDGDGFSNIAEYREQTNPNDELSMPEQYNPLGRYRLVRIYQKPLELLFEGYMHLPDGSYSFVINAQKSSHFKKLGETIKEYKIVDFKKKLVSQNRMGVEITEDASELYLEGQDGERITLKYHKITSKKQLWAQIEDTDNKEVMEMQEGDTFGPFSISSISDNGLEVSDEESNKYILKYERR